MSKTVADQLREARKLIEKPENWTQHVYARNSKRREVDFDDPKAKCFCSIGACLAIGLDYHHPARAFLKVAMENNPLGFNDNHTHAEVLAAFDRAIEAAARNPSEAS